MSRVSLRSSHTPSETTGEHPVGAKLEILEARRRAGRSGGKRPSVRAYHGGRGHTPGSPVRHTASRGYASGGGAVGKGSARSPSPNRVASGP